MAKPNNRLIEGLLLAVIVGSFYIVIQPFNEANALQLTSVSTGGQSPNITIPIVYNSFNAHAVISGSKNLLVVNASNNHIMANMSLPVSAGKLIQGIDCQNTAQTQKSTTIGKGGTEYCVVTTTGGSGLDTAFLVDVTNGVSTGWGAFFHNGYMFSNCIIWNIPQIAGTVVCMYSDTAVANHVFIDYFQIPYHYANGVPTTPDLGKNFTQTTHFDSGYTSGFAQPNFMRMTVLLNAITGLTTYEMMWSLHGGTQVALFNLGSVAQICTIGTGTEAFNIQFATDPSGVNKWYATTDNAIKVITDATCTLTNTLSLSSYDGSASHIRGLAIGAIRKEMYIYDDLGNMVSMNQSTFTKIAQFKISGDSVGVGSNRQVITTNDNLLINGAGQTDLGMAVSSGTTYFIQYWATAGSGGGSTTTGTGNTCGAVNPKNCVGQVNCELPANANLVMCFTNNNNSTNGFNAGTQVINNTASTVAQGLGLTNLNIKTNGVGYIFLFITLLLGNIMWLLAVHSFGNRGIVVPQPIFVSVLISLCIIMGFVVMGFTDPLILILAVVVVVAFTAPKAVSMIRGSEPVST